MKSKDGKPDLFIPIRNGSKKSSVQLVSIRGMEKLRSHIPTTKDICDNLLVQKRFLEIDKNYVPKPITIRLGEFDYNNIINEIKIKYPNYNHNKIPLIASSISKPVIIIEKTI